MIKVICYLHSLKPNEEWAHIVNLLNFFNRDNENEYRRLENEMLAKKERLWKKNLESLSSWIMLYYEQLADRLFGDFV